MANKIKIFTAVQPLENSIIMANREKIAIGEYYHIYNRGVDKRQVVKDNEDADRFIKSLEFFNSKEPIISLRDVISDNDNKTKNLLTC